MEEEEGALEAELEEHLTENRESLQAVEDALASDASNTELLLVFSTIIHLSNTEQLRPNLRNLCQTPSCLRFGSVFSILNYFLFR
jgi:hypothetical protein